MLTLHSGPACPALHPSGCSASIARVIFSFLFSFSSLFPHGGGPPASHSSITCLLRRNTMLRCSGGGAEGHAGDRPGLLHPGRRWAKGGVARVHHRHLLQLPGRLLVRGGSRVVAVVQASWCMQCGRPLVMRGSWLAPRVKRCRLVHSCTHCVLHHGSSGMARGVPHCPSPPLLQMWQSACPC